MIEVYTVQKSVDNSESSESIDTQRNALEKTDYTGNRIAQLTRYNSIRET